METIKQDPFLQEAKNFFETNKEIFAENVKDGSKIIIVDYMKLAEECPEVAEQLDPRPEETIQLLEIAVEEIEWMPNNPRVRFKNLSQASKIPIREIRAKHLGRFISISGVIRQSSEVRPKEINTKFECPTCLPKGTKVMTPNGLENIEDVDVVKSVDEDFNILNKKVNVIKTGKKKVWKINTLYKSLYSSKDHKWIVYRNGIAGFIQTKDIKIGDIIYGIDNKEMQDMWEENNKRTSEEEKKNVQLELQKDSKFLSAKEWGKSKDRYKENDKVIPEGAFYGTTCGDLVNESQFNKEKINEVWDYNKNLERTMYNLCEKLKYIQAWKEMWGKRIQEISKTELPMDMRQMWGDEEQDKGASRSSQGWKSFKQFSREFRGAMRFVPYEVTSLGETEKEVEMYDLQVPDTNNFILAGGIITHNCGTIISVLQIDSSKHKEPSRCSCGRRGGFKEISKDMVDSQSIVVEEPHDSLEHSTQPKRIRVLLTEDLAEPKMENKTTPGNRVNVIGILKEVERTKNGKKTNIYEINIDANNVIPLQDDLENIHITDEDVEEIKRLSREDPLDRITKSFAPSICGNEKIKKALVLQLFGGNRIVRGDGTTRRGDVNILLIGDPGAAKSQLLKYTSYLSPKSRYVSGMSTSGVGITATVTKDEMTGEYALQAGAMVLANNGHILIDELDKMNPEDRSNLHEAMSLQTITISKATVQAVLNTRTSVLAAANPKFGRFDPAKPIVKQMNLVPTLLSRFDCIFVMRDIPNKERDNKIAEHILSEDVGRNAPMDSEFIRKYVSYAKKNIFPKMSKEAVEMIKKFYVGLRNDNRKEEGESIPIGARQLEALVRLAEASAKLRLSEKVTKADAQVAIDVITDYLGGVGFDEETKKIDVDRIYGTPNTERKRIEVLLKSVEKISRGNPNNSASMEDIKSFIGDKMTEEQVEDGVYKLNRQGDILKSLYGYKKI